MMWRASDPPVVARPPHLIQTERKPSSLVFGGSPEGRWHHMPFNLGVVFCSLGASLALSAAATVARSRIMNCSDDVPREQVPHKRIHRDYKRRAAWRSRRRLRPLAVQRGGLGGVGVRTVRGGTTVRRTRTLRLVFKKAIGERSFEGFLFLDGRRPNRTRANCARALRGNRRGGLRGAGRWLLLSIYSSAGSAVFIVGFDDNTSPSLCGAIGSVLLFCHHALAEPSCAILGRTNKLSPPVFLSRQPKRPSPPGASLGADVNTVSGFDGPA